MILLSSLLFLAQGTLAGESPVPALTRETSAALTVTNLGVAVTTVTANERWLAVARLEFDEGLDLNGDGDTMDQVLFVYDRQKDTLSNLLFVVQGVPRFRGPLLPFGAYELPMQTDLNGDGDEIDDVIHVYDARDGSVRSTGVAAHTRFPLGPEEYMNVVAGSLFYLVDEDNEARDLNGDGDIGDDVLRFAPLPKRPQRPGLAWNLSSSAGFPGMESVVQFAFDVAGTTVIARYEEAEGGAQDLNGDGDTGDLVLHAIDAKTLQATNYQRAGTVFHVFGERASVSILEEQEGVDLNGDGDTDDGVLHVLDVRDGSFVSTGKAGLFHMGLLGDTLCFPVSEYSEGEDLNGDGDTDDGVVHLFDLGAQTLTNTMLSAVSNDMGFSGTRFLFTVYEFAQGSGDLNGDGDLNDAVLHAAHTSGTVLNLVTAGRMGDSSERLVAFAVDEEDQGADFNFDGDLDDLVLGVYDGQLDVFRNLAIATQGAVDEVVEGPRILFEVWERNEGGRDLNGDGDALDFVPHVYDADTNTVLNLGLAIGGSYRDADLEGNLVTIPVSEGAHGGVDLNGDGDTLDSVLHLVELP